MNKESLQSLLDDSNDLLLRMIDEDAIGKTSQTQFQTLIYSMKMKLTRLERPQTYRRSKPVKAAEE